MSGEPIDQNALVEELAASWTGLADPERARGLLKQLVADWAREADPMPDPAAVLRYQREDLDSAIARSGGDPVRGVELELLRRRLGQVSAAAFKLAQETFDGKLDAADSKAQGETLLERIEQIRSKLDAFDANEATDAIRRSAGEAYLDALYAIERKAMSQRLAHANPGAPDSPPSIG